MNMFSCIGRGFKKLVQQAELEASARAALSPRDFRYWRRCYYANAIRPVKEPRFHKLDSEVQLVHLARLVHSAH